MSYDSYKAWIDAMPIDEVRRKIERLERKLADMQVLERLYSDRHGEGAAGGEGEGEGEEQAPPAGGWLAGEGEQQGEGERQGEG
jgi:hypothetical protein